MIPGTGDYECFPIISSADPRWVDDEDTVECEHCGTVYTASELNAADFHAIELGEGCPDKNCPWWTMEEGE